MSSSLIKAHGGSKDLLGSKGQIVSSSMFVQDTLVGKRGSASDKHLERLVSNTIGEPRGKPVMDGVLSDTKQGVKDTNVPELHKVSGKGKTQPKRMGQVPFSGKNY